MKNNVVDNQINSVTESNSSSTIINDQITNLNQSASVSDENDRFNNSYKKNNKFEANTKYFTISCYIIAVVLISIFAFRTINNWESTRKFLRAVIAVISPYFIGFLLAYLVNPLINTLYARVFRDFLKIQNKKIKTALSIFFSYLIVLGIAGICIVYIVPQLISSITELVTQFPEFYNNVLAWFESYVDKNPNLDPELISSITNDYLPHMQEYILKHLQNIVPALYGISISIIKFLVNLFIALIVSVYLVIDKRKIVNYNKTIVYALFSKEHANSLFQIAKDCNAICKSFFIGKTIDSLIIGCMCFVIMTICQLPYSVLISVIVAITNMIPYFGPYIGAIPGVIILFIDKPLYGLIFLIIIICLQAFDGIFLGPKILGNSTGLRPIIILFAISCGGAIAGPLGMFIGVPVFGIISYLIDNFISNRLKAKNITLEENANKKTKIKTRKQKKK